MKPFRFTLQAVHTVRANEEKKALEAFAHAQADVQKLLGIQQRLQTEIESLLADRSETLKRPASADAIQRMQIGVKALNFQLHQCNADLQKAVAISEEKSRLLLAARQKREVVDKLHNKQLARHTAHEAKIEQKTIDDFSAMKASGRASVKWR